MLLKLLIVILLLAVVGSLFSSLFFLQRDRGASTRPVRALTVRIALSLLLFAVLVIAFHLGWLVPGR